MAGLSSSSSTLDSLPKTDANPVQTRRAFEV
jgi:hypothetical protein